LRSAVAATAPQAGVRWLDEAVAAVHAAAPEQKADLVMRWSPGARRRLGDGALGLAGPTLATACGPLPTAPWRAGDTGRACLLLAAVEALGDAGGERAAVLADTLFRAGDEGERAALVRALCLLPAPCAAAATAKAAGRINSLRLYAALALDNPFPAACYGERDFNQVVLKCLFNGLPVGRIMGLDRRAGAELARMCEDYRDERVAAGRAVPPDIWLALVPHGSERGLALALAALDDSDAGHRLNAARALASRGGEPAVAAELARRRESETDPAVRAALDDARGI